MRRLILLFCCLQIIFGSLWVVKAKSPDNRPDAYAYGVDERAGAWWLQAEDLPNVNDEWYLDPEIPLNYIPVLGEQELYMVIGEDGRIEGYRRRNRQEDGSWLWEDVNPDIPEHYEAVEGLEDVYKVTNSDGTVQYLKYVRNEDDSYCFVEVDENGKEIVKEASDGMSIPENYHRVRGNVYAVVNENGVVVKYMERILNDDGSYQWVECEKPAENQPQKQTPKNSEIPVQSQPGTRPQNPGQQSGDGITIINPGVSREPITGGGYVETETIMDRKTSGGWTITYQTIITRTYDAQGKLLSTKKEGPVEISKVQSVSGGSPAAPDTNTICSTLSAEYNRVTGGLTFRNDLAESVLTQLNAERSANGLVPLQMNTGSNVYQIAAIKAADMATYNHSDFDSPLYGELSELLTRFGISSSGPSETLWRTTATKTAKDIHTRFQVQEYSRLARMSGNYSSVGIAIVEKNGYLYIAEIFI